MSPSGGRKDLRLFAYLEQIQSTKEKSSSAQQRAQRSAEPSNDVVSVAAIFRDNPAYRAYQRKISQQSASNATSGSTTPSADVKPRATMLTMPNCPLHATSPASSDRTTPVEATVAQQQRRTNKRVRAAKENLNSRERDMKKRKKRL